MPVATFLQECFPLLLGRDILVRVLKVLHNALYRSEQDRFRFSGRRLRRRCRRWTCATLEEREGFAIARISLVNVTIWAKSMSRRAHGRWPVARLCQEVARCVEQRKSDECVR